MSELAQRIEKAKKDNGELNHLLSEYMPFIVRTVREAEPLGMEYDDRLSLAMLVFANCVKQYQEERGGFIAFATTCIRNRLIDESRRQSRMRAKILPFPFTGEDRNTEIEMNRASLDIFSLTQEREALSQEIEALSIRLTQYGISFQELPRICPKQEKSRKQCIELARFIASHEEMRNHLLTHRRLMQTELARQFGLSEKTVEKHRKYIVTIVLLLCEDYPFIRAFLPQYKEVSQ